VGEYKLPSVSRNVPSDFRKSRNFIRAAAAILAALAAFAGRADALTIIPVYNSSVTSSPDAANLEATVQAACNVFSADFSSPVTVYLNVFYSTAQTSGAAASPTLDFNNPYSYSALEQAMSSHIVSTDDWTATTSLSQFNPPTTGSIYLSYAQEMAMGLVSSYGTQSAGQVFIYGNGDNVWNWSSNRTADSSKGDLEGTAEHEIAHALGRYSNLQEYGANTYTLIDLYRYQMGTGTPTRVLSSTSTLTGGLVAPQNTMASLNGYTNLGEFDYTSDPSDWYNPWSNANGRSNDAFNAFYSGGQENNMSAQDLQLMDALGFTRAYSPVVNQPTTPSANFSDPTAWSAGHTPVSTDLVYVGAGAAFVDRAATVSTLTVDNNASVTMSGPPLTVLSSLTVGLSGDGTFTQNGGSNTVNGMAVLGYNGGTYGMYTLNAGTLSAGSLYIGFSGGGSVNQGGGLVTAGSACLAFNQYSNGSYYLTAGSLSAGSLYVGCSGAGIFTQYGGVASAGTAVYLGYNNIGSGAYSLSGGSLLASFEYIGYSGSGTLSQSSGAHILSEAGYNGSTLYLGYNTGSSGTYQLSGGMLTAPFLNVGYYGNGSFQQSGGAANFTTIGVGSVGGGSGSCILNAGTITDSYEQIGVSGSGTFTQNGGVNSVSVFMALADDYYSLGTYNLNGGLLSLGGLQLGPAGSAAFNFSGGTLQAANSFITTVPIQLTGAATFDSNGSGISLSGALFGHGALQKIGGGSLILLAANTYSGSTAINGGTLAVGGTGSLGSGTYSQSISISSGAVLNYGSNAAQTLSGVLSGAGGLTQSGNGVLSLTNANLYLGGTIVNGGTLSLGYNNGGAGTLQGTLTINPGGTVVTAVNNALGYSGSNWVQTININGGVLTTSVATDNGWGTTINMTGGTVASSLAGGYFAMGTNNSAGPPTFNITGTNTPALISANLQDRADNGNPGITFNILQRGSAASDLNISGNILSVYGATGITLNGMGIMTLSGSNTYTGPTIINGGTLNAVASGASSSFGALPDGAAVTVNSGAALILTRNGATDAIFKGTITGAGATIITGSGPTNDFLNLSGTDDGVSRLSSSGDLTINNVGLNLFGNSQTFGALNGNGSGAIISNGGGGGFVTITLGNNNDSGAFAGSIGSRFGVTSTETILLVKTGSGTQILSGQNTYSGNTGISGGVLEFAQTSAMPGTGSVNVAAGATLAAGIGGSGGFTTASTATQGSIGGLLAGLGSQGTSVIAWSPSANLGIDTTNAAGGATYGGTITNIGANMLGLDKLGGNMLTLNGANSYSGTTTVSGGTLLVLSRASGNDAPYVVDSGATLRIGYTTGGGYANTAMTIFGSGTASTSGFALAGGQGYNCSGGVQLVGSPTTIRQYGSGLASLGTYDINSAGLWSTAAASGSVIDRNVQLTSMGYGMSVQTDAGVNTATGDLTIEGPLNVGNLGLFKYGTGSLLLNGTAASGNTAVNIVAGTVVCGTANCLGANANVAISAGAALELNGINQTIPGLSGLGSVVNLSPVAATLAVSASTSVTFPGMLGGGAAYANNFIFAAVGGLVNLTGTNNTYTGGTTITAGTLNAVASGVSGAFGALPNGGAVTVNEGASLILTRNGTTDSIFNGIISGAGATIITGSGPTNAFLNLSGANDGVNRLSPSGDLTINNVGLNLFGNSQTFGALNGNGSGAIISNGGGGGFVTITLGNNNDSGAFAGSIGTRFGVNSSETISLVKTGSGTQILSGYNSYSAGTAIAAGVLDFLQTSAMPYTGTVTVEAGATLAAGVGGSGGFTAASTATQGSIGGLLAGLGSQGTSVIAWSPSANLGIDTTNAAGGATYGGTITNIGSNMLGLDKLGGNMLTLTGANSYSGTTTVSGGTLLVLSRASGSDTPYVVDSGATLRIGYTTGGGYANTAMRIYGSGTASTSGFALAGGQGYNCSGGVQLVGAPTTIRQYGSGLASLGTFDINSVGLWSTAAASGSVIDPNIQITSLGYGMSVQTDSGANTAAGDLTIDGPLNVGNLGIFKHGTGSLLLNGTASSGNTAVNILAGTVICGTANCLGANSSVPISAGATLQLNGFNQTIAGLSGSGSVVNLSPAAATLAVNGSSNGTFSGTLGGGAAYANNFTLTIAGGSVLTLTGSNNYTGGTTISQGSLIAMTPGALGGGNIVMNDANTGSNNTALTISASNSLPNNVTVANQGSGMATVTFGGSVGASGIYSPIGSLTLNNSTTLNFAYSGNSYYQLATPVSGGGPLTISGSNYLLAHASWSSYTGPISIAAGSDFDFRGFLGGSATNALTVNGTIWEVAGDVIGSLSGSGTVSTISAFGSGAETLTIGNGGASGTFSGAVAQQPNQVLSVTKVGGGMQTFTGNDTYTGATTITAGTLAIAGSGSLGGSYSGNIAIGSVAVFSYNSTAPETFSGAISGGGILSVNSQVSFSGNTSAFGGQLINDGAIVVSSPFYAGQGIVNNGTIAVSAGGALGVSGGLGSTLSNEGTITLTGGTIAGGQTSATGGPIVNNGLISGYGALTSGAGITNNGQIMQSGGNLAISAGTAGAVNNGIISLAEGYQFLLSGSTLENTQSINLDSGMFSGTGTLNNSSGTVSGPGTISMPFLNSGTLSVPQGTTSITRPFTNAGVIQLIGFGASLSSGQIANLGEIQGSGAVTASCSNAGTIAAAGGALTLSGSVQNGASGLISAGGGSEILIPSGLAANYGTVNLAGGIFDNNLHALSNYGQLSGYGTWQTGGLTNLGIISFAGGPTTLSGSFTNASGGTVSVSNSPAVFTGTVVNNGYVKITGTTVTYAGSFSNNGTYLSDPAVNNFASLSIGPAGLLKGGIGDRFTVTGAVNNSGDIDLGGTSTMLVGNGAGTLTQSAGTVELGTSGSLTAGLVQINGGIVLADGHGGLVDASLIYDSPEASAYQGELAGIASSLNLNNPAAVLVLSGSNTYGGGTIVTSGELAVDNSYSLPDGSSLMVGDVTGVPALAGILGGQPAGAGTPALPVPEPGTLLLFAAATVLWASRRMRRLWTALLELQTAASAQLTKSITTLPIVFTKLHKGK
jgi:fibronectin-binding autotransporter adhesin